VSLEWWLSLTPHQLDVIRTIASVITGAFGGILIPLLGWGIKLLRANRRDSQTAVRNTQHEERVDGTLKPVSVTEYARQAAYASTDAADTGRQTGQATADLALWVKGKGRRREPTREVPTVSHYTGEPNE
jgi:hypothetical protein